jgi:hypothetical protein
MRVQSAKVLEGIKSGAGGRRQADYLVASSGAAALAVRFKIDVQIPITFKNELI